MSEDGPALLVVDDNEDNRYTLTRRLKRQGYENLTTAENGQEALDLLAKQPFDLVLLDIMMPVMNGYEVLEHIKSDMALRDVPVIMISAVDEMESIVRCIKAGAEDHLPKPFNASLLIVLLRQRGHFLAMLAITQPSWAGLLSCFATDARFQMGSGRNGRSDSAFPARISRIPSGVIHIRLEPLLKTPALGKPLLIWVNSGLHACEPGSS